MRRQLCCVLGVQPFSASQQEEKLGWLRVCIYLLYDCNMSRVTVDFVFLHQKLLNIMLSDDTASHIEIWYEATCFLFPNRLLFQKKATLRRMKKEWCFEYKEIVQLLNALRFHWLQWMNFKCDYEWCMAGSFYHVYQFSGSE